MPDQTNDSSGRPDPALGLGTDTEFKGVKSAPQHDGDYQPDNRLLSMAALSAAGFRRRCAWCGVALRGWQVNMCRRCKTALVTPYAPAPCVHASRWDDEPDRWRWGRG